MTEKSENGRSAVLYARVSTRGQAEQGYNLAQRIEALQAWCEREGCEVLEAVEDSGQSGVSLERPGMDRVRDLVESGGVDVVVAQERDRFAREPTLVYLLKQEFAGHGTKLRSLNDHGGDTPEGELADGILDQIAKFERAKTAERIRRGKLKKVREGKLIRGPRAPYGLLHAHPHVPCGRAREFRLEGDLGDLTHPEHMLRQRRQMQGNPDKEARDLIERLQKLERRRSRYIDLAADRDISREELRAKLAEVDERREALQKALREARDRQETIQELQQNRKMLETAFERFAEGRGLGLALLGPEDCRQVFQALRLRVVVNKHGDVGISGVFDADITEELLRGSPTERRGAGRHSVVRYETSPPFRGNITVDNTRRPVPKIPEVTRVADTSYRSYCSGCWPQPTR